MTSPFLTWSTEAEAHAAKKITVTVRIDFIIPPVAGRLPDFNRAQLPRVVRDAVAKWHGHFKCYEFVVNVDFRIIDSRALVRADALDVLIREGFPYGQTRSSGSADKTHWMSDDPADTVTPLRGNSDNFSFVGLDSNLLSHELGHMIGLHDGYTETDSGSFWDFGTPAPTAPTPGHEPDVMQRPALPVTSTTIARAVRRHYGPSFEKNMLCPIGLKVGPSTLDLFLAAVEDITLDATAPRYDPPTSDQSVTPEPAVFTGTFHAKGDYLTRFPGLPWSASGTLDLPVTFSVDFSQMPIALNVDLSFWQLSQTLEWDADTGLPYALGPLLIHSDGAVLDSAQLWPGPALQPEFYVPPPATA